MVSGDRARNRPAVATWIARRGSLPALAAVTAIVGAALAVPATFSTPQLSGADVPLTTGAAAGAVAGFCFGYLGESREAIIEARSVRDLRGRRTALAVTVLLVAALTVPLGHDTWNWDACRNFLVMAGASVLLVRFAGTFVAAVAFAGYVGGCLFIGAPLDTSARWWAVLIHHSTGPTSGLLAATGFAIAATLIATASLRPARR